MRKMYVCKWSDAINEIGTSHKHRAFDTFKQEMNEPNKYRFLLRHSNRNRDISQMKSANMKSCE